MTTIRSLIGALLTRLFGLFGWRGQRGLIALRDRLDFWRSGPSRFPPQPWRMQPDYPAGSITLAAIPAPPPVEVVQPDFHGSAQPPLIGGKPFTRMHVLPRHLRRVPDVLVIPGYVTLDAGTTLLTRAPGTLTYVLGRSTDPKRLYLAPWSIDLSAVEQAIESTTG